MQLNPLTNQLKQQYKDRIDFLQTQIIQQKNEIDQLKNQIKIITEGKLYDV